MDNLKKYLWIPILAIIVGIVFAVIATEYKKKNVASNDVFCYNLPQDQPIVEVGSKYWFALHDVVGKIPCSICRDDATSFMKFFHDYVNIKTGKPVYDRTNYDRWIKELNTQNLTLGLNKNK